MEGQAIYLAMMVSGEASPQFFWVRKTLGETKCLSLGEKQYFC